MCSAHPLGVYAGASLSVAQFGTLGVLAAHDLEQVQSRLQIKAILPEPLIGVALLEFRRFLALHALLEDPPTMFSKPVDEVWHTSIMFTRQYLELCHLAFGRPIHHCPITRHEFGGSTASSHAQGRFLAFRAAYERYFGPIHPLWTYNRPWAATDGYGHL